MPGIITDSCPRQGPSSPRGRKPMMVMDLQLHRGLNKQMPTSGGSVLLWGCLEEALKEEKRGRRKKWNADPLREPGQKNYLLRIQAAPIGTKAKNNIRLEVSSISSSFRI
jgi:hypothetical protein